MTDDPIAESKEFDKKVTDFTWGGHKNRVVVRWLASLFVVVILLIALNGYNTIHLHAVTQQQELLTCVSGNRVRADEQQLWTYVFEKIEPAHATAEQKEAFDAFLNQVHKDLKLRACATLYG